MNFFQFWVIKTLDPDWFRIRIGIEPKILDPDPYKMNTDPKPWYIQYLLMTNLWEQGWRGTPWPPSPPPAPSSSSPPSSPSAPRLDLCD
jgi:hypothetical protein